MWRFPVVWAVAILFVTNAAFAQQDVWKLVFEDDFERAELGDAWDVKYGDAGIREGKLWMDGETWVLTARSFASDVRMEFDAQTLPGVAPCDLSATLCSGDKSRWGYLLGFGAQANRVNHIRGPGVNMTDTDPPFVVERDRRYDVVAEKEGLRVAMIVNGTTILEATTLDPLVGEGNDRAGFITWTGMQIDRVRIYERAEPHPDTPRVFDALAPGPLVREGRQLRIPEGAETPALRRAVEAFNSRDLDTALAAFEAMGPTPAGLLGRAYVLGDIDFAEPFYHDLFTTLAADFAAAAAADPENTALADYAVAARWFGYLVMWRTRMADAAANKLLDLGPDNNPFFYKAKLYAARYLHGGALEGGLASLARQARESAAELLAIWPDHRTLRQYAGENIPWGDELIADVENHPAWAAYLREAYARNIRVMERFIEVRQAEDGQLGGGWGDDVEMLRSWAQVASISSGAGAVRDGIEKLCQGVWDNVLVAGYDNTVSDVEHSAEPSADTIPYMLLMRYGDPVWVERNLETCRTIKDYFMGVDDLGYPRFKASIFGAFQVQEDPLLGSGDTGYCARAMKHFLYAAWQGNDDARDWFVRWADGWRDLTMRPIDTKLPGVVPFTIWYPTAQIHPPREDGTWYGEKYNYIKRPDMIHDVFLAAYWMTRDRKFVQPWQAAMDMGTYGPLLRGAFEPGSATEQIRQMADLPGNMSTEQNKSAVYHWLTGDTVYDEYALKSGDSTHRYLINKDLSGFLRTFESTAQGLRHNMEMKTMEVMATDRAGIGQANPIFGAYTGAITGMRDAFCPTFSVIYDTPSIDFAALVVHSSTERIRIWFYNFEDKPIPVGLQLFQLTPGLYVLNQGEQVDGEVETQKRYAWVEPQGVAVRHFGGGPTIQVPPGKTWVVDLRLHEERPVPAQAPDLAISRRGIRGEGDRVVVTVHNIGNGDAGAFRVLLEQQDGAAWKEVAAERVSGLKAPQALMPETRDVALTIPAGAGAAPWRVRVERLDDDYERYEGNNTVTMAGRG